MADAAAAPPIGGTAALSRAGERTWRLTMAAVLAAAFAVAIYGGLARRGLYYDGAYFLLGRLSKEAIDLFELARQAVHAMGQAPVVAAIRLDLVDLGAAIRVHSLTLQVLPLLLTGVSCFFYPRGRRHLFVFALLHYLGGTLAAAVYPNTEPSLAAAYFWLLLPLVLFQAQRLWGFAALVLLALPYAVTYEAMFLLSPFLAAAAGWRRHRAAGRMRFAWALLTVWFLACTALQLYWAIVPQFPHNRDGLVAALFALRWLDEYSAVNVPALLGLVAIAALAALRGLELARAPARRPVGFAVVLAIAVLAVVLVVRPLLDARFFDPLTQMFARTQPIFVSAPLGAALLWSVLRLRVDLAVPSPGGAAIVGIVAAASLAWHLVAIRHWSDFLRDYVHVLERHRGLIPWSAAVAAAPEGGWRLKKFAPGWRAPTLSIVLSPGGRVTTLIAGPPEQEWTPFDPAKPEQIPRSRFYDLSPYLRALAEQREGRP
jgi:hypothetical protein